MNYPEYLQFYDLPETPESHDDWLYNEWRHGRAHLYDGVFYRMGTGENLGVFNVRPSIDVSLPQINRDKLKQYLEEDMILEFASAEECMEYFNTYDGQNFQTVDDMKAYQVQYGFGLDGKWYHICFDEALDVWEKPTLNHQIQDAESKTTNQHNSHNHHTPYSEKNTHTR